MLLHTATCLLAVGFAFIFVPPQLLLEQLARTRGAAGKSATPFLCYRPCLSFRQFLPPFSVPFRYFPPSTLPPSPPFFFFTLPIGPASHCGWSRLSSIFPPPLALTTTPSHYLGPACHCGRSRLVSPPFLSIHLPYPHHPHIAYTSHLYTPATTLLLARLVIVAGPAYPPHFQHLTTLSPSSSSYYHPPLPTLPLSYIVARLVIVAGPAISSYPGISLTPPSSLFPLPTSTYKPTPPPLQATGPACHCGWSRLSPLHILSLSSIHTPHLLLS